MQQRYDPNSHITSARSSSNMSVTTQIVFFKRLGSAWMLCPSISLLFPIICAFIYSVLISISNGHYNAVISVLFAYHVVLVLCQREIIKYAPSKRQLEDALYKSRIILPILSVLVSSIVVHYGTHFLWSAIFRIVLPRSYYESFYTYYSVSGIMSMSFMWGFKISVLFGLLNTFALMKFVGPFSVGKSLFFK